VKKPKEGARNSHVKGVRCGKTGKEPHLKAPNEGFRRKKKRRFQQVQLKGDSGKSVFLN